MYFLYNVTGHLCVQLEGSPGRLPQLIGCLLAQLQRDRLFITTIITCNKNTCTGSSSEEQEGDGETRQEVTRLRGRGSSDRKFPDEGGRGSSDRKFPDEGGRGFSDRGEEEQVGGSASGRPSKTKAVIFNSCEIINHKVTWL